MWNTFSSLHSRFKSYKEKYLATFAKPKKYLKAGQQNMFHGDQLGLLSFTHKGGPCRDHPSLHQCHQPLWDTLP